MCRTQELRPKPCQGKVRKKGRARIASLIHPGLQLSVQNELPNIGDARVSGVREGRTMLLRGKPCARYECRMRE